MAAITYWSWRLFIVQISGDNYILNLGATVFLKALNGLFDGSLIKVLIPMFWALITVLPVMAFSLLVTKKSNETQRLILFLKLVEVFGLIVYTGGIYIFSFQSAGWIGVVNDSLMRSSISLLIIPLIIFGVKLKEYAKR